MTVITEIETGIKN